MEKNWLKASIESRSVLHDQSKSGFLKGRLLSSQSARAIW